MKIISLLLLFIPFSYTQLVSNNLIGKYVASFSVPPNTVPLKDWFYEFTISKALFDEKISETNVTF